MTPHSRTRSLRLTFVVIAAALWAWALGAAIPAGINDGPSGACIDASDERVVFESAVQPESVAVDGSWQLFPLGVGCRYTASTGESVFIAPGILGSVIGIHALVFTVLLGAVVVRDLPPAPRRHDDLQRA